MNDGRVAFRCEACSTPLWAVGHFAACGECGAQYVTSVLRIDQYPRSRDALAAKLPPMVAA